MEICIQAFKHRDQTPLSVEAVRQAVDTARPWCTFQGSIENVANEPTLVQVDAKSTGTLDFIMPCAALVTVKLDGKLAAFSNLVYPTVIIGTPSPSMGSLICVDTHTFIDKKQQAAFDQLPSTITRTLTLVKRKLTLVLTLLKNPDFDGFVCKDDNTGQAYPYMLSTVTVCNLG